MSRYILTPHKDGMTWRTKHDEQETMEGAGEAVKKLLGRGFTYITIEAKLNKE